MRWSEEQYADLMRRRAMPASLQDSTYDAPTLARGALPANKMNKLEAAYYEHLESLKILGEVIWHRYEPIKLRLADGSFYTPDFGVLLRAGLFEFHETKGFWRESAKVRIKVAAEIFPFKFIAIKRAKGGGWEREEFS